MTRAKQYIILKDFLWALGITIVLYLGSGSRSLNFGVIIPIALLVVVALLHKYEGALRRKLIPIARVLSLQTAVTQLLPLYFIVQGLLSGALQLSVIVMLVILPILLLLVGYVYLVNITDKKLA
jgi:hypothetical protein